MNKKFVSLLLICLLPAAYAQQAATPSIEELEKQLQKKQTDQDAAQRDAEAVRAREAAEKQRQREAEQYRSQPDVSLSGLPREVQADMLETRIKQAFSRGDHGVALSALDQYRKLGLTPALPLVYGEVLAANESKDAIRALAALEEFLRRTPREGQQYKDALAMYPEFKSWADEAVAIAKQAEVYAKSDILLMKAQQLVAEGKFADAQYLIAFFMEKPNPANLALAESLQQQVTSGIDSKSRELVAELLNGLEFTAIPKGSLLKWKKGEAPTPVASFKMSTRPLNKKVHEIFCTNVYDYNGGESSTKYGWRQWQFKNDIKAYGGGGYCGSSSMKNTISKKIVEWLNKHSGRSFRLLTENEWARVFAGGLPAGIQEMDCNLIFFCSGGYMERYKEIERRRSREFGKTIVLPADYELVCLDSQASLNVNAWVHAGGADRSECQSLYLVET